MARFMATDKKFVREISAGKTGWASRNLHAGFRKPRALRCYFKVWGDVIGQFSGWRDLI